MVTPLISDTVALLALISKRDESHAPPWPRLTLDGVFKRAVPVIAQESLGLSARLMNPAARRFVTPKMRTSTSAVSVRLPLDEISTVLENRLNPATTMFPPAVSW